MRQERPSGCINKGHKKEKEDSKKREKKGRVSMPAHSLVRGHFVLEEGKGKGGEGRGGGGRRKEIPYCGCGLIGEREGC